MKQKQLFLVAFLLMQMLSMRQTFVVELTNIKNL